MSELIVATVVSKIPNAVSIVHNVISTVRWEIWAEHEVVGMAMFEYMRILVNAWYGTSTNGD